MFCVLLGRGAGINCARVRWRTAGAVAARSHSASTPSQKQTRCALLRRARLQRLRSASRWSCQTLRRRPPFNLTTARTKQRRCECLVALVIGLCGGCDSKVVSYVVCSARVVCLCVPVTQAKLKQVTDDFVRQIRSLSQRLQRESDLLDEARAHSVEVEQALLTAKEEAADYRGLVESMQEELSLQRKLQHASTLHAEQAQLARQQLQESRAEAAETLQQLQLVQQKVQFYPSLVFVFLLSSCSTRGQSGCSLLYARLPCCALLAADRGRSLRCRRAGTITRYVSVERPRDRALSWRRPLFSVHATC